MNRKTVFIFFACLSLVLGMTVLGLATEKQPLAQRHADKDVACQDCHMDPSRIEPQNSACITCHGTIEKMAAQTTVPQGGMYMEHVNPHAHHLGPLECYACHRIHKRADETNPCTQCHSLFTLDLP